MDNYNVLCNNIDKGFFRPYTPHKANPFLTAFQAVRIVLSSHLLTYRSFEVYASKLERSM